MNWRDFFYFSTGERSALILLLCLLSALWLVQSFSSFYQKDTHPVSLLQGDTIRDTLPREPVVHPVTARKQPPATSVPARVKKDSLPQKRKFFSPDRSKTAYPASNKYKAGTVIELNNADTTSLKKVPGIGTVFSRRIVKYRNLLGGFYSVGQLKEVYGMDEEKYRSLQSWFYVDTTFIQPLKVNEADYPRLYRHPYLNKEQTKAILNLRKQKSRLSGWENLLLLPEFSTKDVEKLVHYLSFD